MFFKIKNIFTKYIKIKTKTIAFYYEIIVMHDKKGAWDYRVHSPRQKNAFLSLTSVDSLFVFVSTIFLTLDCLLQLADLSCLFLSPQDVDVPCIL